MFRGRDYVPRTKRPPRKRRKFVGTKRYAPSLLGIEMGLTALKTPRMVTGFGIRPMVRRRKTRR